MNGDELKKKSDMADEELHMARELHKCIDSGDIVRARLLIDKLSQEERQRLTKPIKELGMPPAIFFAIEKDRIEFVEFLVNECKVDYEEQAVCTDASFLWFGGATGPCLLSPLEFAFFCFKRDIAEFLLNVGANALRLAKDVHSIWIAITNYSLKTLGGLVEFGADLNMPDKKGNTYLMEAVALCGVGLCRFLLEKGIDVNCRNIDGNTALTIKSPLDNYGCVKLLLERGADPFSKNNNGEDVLRVASLNGAKNTVNFLTETVFKDVKRQIESYHLLGTSFLVNGEGVTEALSMWSRAIMMSSENLNQVSPAKLTTPFGVAVEATLLSELEDLCLNKDDLFMQSLVLIHKYLGSTHYSFFRAIRSCAKRYFSAGSYDSCLRLLSYCIQMIYNSTLDLSRRCSELDFTFNQIEESIKDFIDNAMVPTFSFGVLYEFMKTTAQEAARCNEPEEMRIFLKLIVRTILLFCSSDFGNHEKMDFHELMRFVIKSRLKSVNGRTLLMEAVDPEMHVLLHVIFAPLPSLDVVSLLVECGVDVNERDQDGNNAVHVLVSAFDEKNIFDFYSITEIADKLIKSNIHLDAKNRYEVDTASCLQRLGIKTTPPINLMCLAARGIRRFNVPYQGLLPEFLVDFVEMH